MAKATEYLKHPVTYIKATLGAILASGAALVGAMADGDSFSQVQDAEWLTVGLAFVASFATVFGVSNGALARKREDGPPA